MNEPRLVDLETKFSFQEASIEELQQTVHDQQMALQRLEKTLKILTDQFKSIASKENEIRSGNEKPPHY